VQARHFGKAPEDEEQIVEKSAVQNVHAEAGARVLRLASGSGHLIPYFLHGLFAARIAVWLRDFGPRSMTSAGLSAICGTASQPRSPHPARRRFG
jgi:hypothetical protein